MDRKAFIFSTGGIVLSAWVSPTLGKIGLPTSKMDRIALGTLLFRYRFQRTKPQQWNAIKEELTLLDVPEHHRDKFGIRKIEFWNEHFESLEPDYLGRLRDKIKSAKSELLNIQIDRISYDLAATDEAERRQSIADVKAWMDAASFLGSKCVRINPGSPKGTVEKSIESLKELNNYAKRKKLTIITANHFGIEMDADKHVQIARESGVYTEPDFGNYIPQYTEEVMMESLSKILPYAHVVSAKMVDFNDHMEHTSYDFDKCIQLAEKAGFKGTYVIAQWSGKFQDIDYDDVARWGIEHVRNHIK
ncbi:sugar phosphate isomerase/epimerase family protein [Parapedobacter indicus]|uniref:Sugar phosphate isomerase/epimerase n=1 Tax=Parapedobacter indicus TaxID=1477437 RepID=A0A1I3LYA6_9SPHI|nr:TIM barrel protein [Parapedobacter indicus]PPL01341.1 sugar phosphate isomerase/epimerase [Parapedobacter indicus]SFI89754.1 Sugar phosphate isomerase/epimerase [Parapedobacter indicus]